MSLIRVAILGAESSGKSTLAPALAERHGTAWVPEYLREFVETRRRVPAAEDQFLIASTQARREDEAAARASRYLFCDTTPLMTAVYSRFYFNGVDAQLAALADARHYGITIVTAPDSPWVEDGLQRASEQVRRLVHQLLLTELSARGIAYTLVEGTLKQRLDQVDRIL